MTKEEKAEAAKIKARLAELSGETEEDDDDADPKAKKFAGLIAKSIVKELKGAGKKVPSKPEKGWLDEFLGAFGIED